MEKTMITFNDLPEVVAQLRDEVMSLRNLLTEQRSENNAKAVDTHVPMSVEDAIVFIETSWTNGWNPPVRIPYPCPMRNSANPYPPPTAASPVNVIGKRHGRGQELYQSDTWRPDEGDPSAARDAGQHRCNEYQDRKPDDT